MCFWGSGKNEKKKFEIGDRVEIRGAIGYVIDRNGDYYIIRTLSGELRDGHVSEIRPCYM